MILYLKDPKYSIKKLISPFVNIERPKLDIQKLLVLQYTNNEQAEKEIMKTIPFTIVSNK
jgi:hypothetical protein